MQVVLPEGNRSLVMGASTKGPGHCIWTSGTPLAFQWTKDMIFGQGAGLGEVASLTYMLLLSEPQETG